MSQPVELSDALLSDARSMSELSERSLAAQIEFWAQLGKAIEPLLHGSDATSRPSSNQTLSLDQALESVNSPEGSQRLVSYLGQLPFPHYEADDTSGLLVRVSEDGSRTLGKFVDGKFVVMEMPPTASDDKG